MSTFSSFYIISLFILTFSFQGYSQADLKRISLEDITTEGTFTAKTVQGIISMKSGESYTVKEKSKRIVQYSYQTGKEELVLFDADEIGLPDPGTFAGYTLSPDETKVLLEVDKTSIYRHSFEANYHIYNIKDKSVINLSENGKQQLATFSPDGKTVAFVRGNNIFLKKIESLKEIQITHDGLLNHIINGAADWVYEEEFALKTGLHWSPDGKRLAFYRFDESRVKQFNMTTYNNSLYPENYTFKYPKAGEENAVVSIHVYDLETGTTLKMDTGTETDQYIARIKWAPNQTSLAMLRLNRLQNKIDILLANAETGFSKILYTEENRFYLEEPTDDYLTFTDDGKNFVILSEREGWNQIYLYDMNGKLVKKLTDGKNEVSKVYGVDTKGKRIYYQAYDDSPLRKAVYVVDFDGKNPVKLSTMTGTNSADFSSGFKYFIHFHSNTTTPTLVSLHNQKGKLIRNLEENTELKNRLANYKIPNREFFSFNTSEDVELHGYIIKPIDFDPQKKYPVFMNQYSGPGSQSAIDRWRIDWDEYLATEGYIIVCVDGRGTGGRGEAFKKMTYGKLGYYESVDQIEAAKYIQSLPFVDANRIGIWGWSYGGYMSALCLFKAPEVFKMAIAVAPVTNWRYYDSVYTERFMGLPKDNASGYDDNSPINHVEKLMGKLLLVHGTGDDNVHFQNTMELADRLIQANKQFELMVYPDENHFIRGGNSYYHLYILMTNYVKANL